MYTYVVPDISHNCNFVSEASSKLPKDTNIQLPNLPKYIQAKNTKKLRPFVRRNSGLLMSKTEKKILFYFISHS